MSGVGQQRETASDHAAHRLGHHDARGDAERDKQPTTPPAIGLLRRTPSTMVVTVAMRHLDSLLPEVKVGVVLVIAQRRRDPGRTQ